MYGLYYVHLYRAYIRPTLGSDSPRHRKELCLFGINFVHGSIWYCQLPQTHIRAFYWTTWTEPDCTKIAAPDSTTQAIWFDERVTSSSNRLLQRPLYSLSYLYKGVVLSEPYSARIRTIYDSEQLPQHRLVSRRRVRAIPDVPVLSIGLRSDT